MLESILAGLVAGVVGTLGTLWAYAHGFIKLELVERRKRKVELVDDLFASRYALKQNYQYSPSEAEHFNRCLARIPFVFGDDRGVINKYDEYVTDVNDTTKLIKLIQEMARSVGIKHVNATYVQHIHTIPSHYKKMTTNHK